MTDLCVRCELNVAYSRTGFCGPCRKVMRAARAARRTAVKLSHIAGYVPPRGSIAWTFLGNVIDPVRGIGVVRK